MTKSSTSFSGLITIALLFLSFCSVDAAVFIIPDGDVSALKAAINTANTNNEDDTIELATNGTYTLTSVDNAGLYGANGLPIIATDASHRLTIQGNGANIQRSPADGTPQFRIFHIDIGADITISNLEITNGNYRIGLSRDRCGHL